MLPLKPLENNCIYYNLYGLDSKGQWVSLPPNTDDSRRRKIPSTGAQTRKIPGRQSLSPLATFENRDNPPVVAVLILVTSHIYYYYHRRRYYFIIYRVAGACAYRQLRTDGKPVLANTVLLCVMLAHADPGKQKRKGLKT